MVSASHPIKYSRWETLQKNAPQTNSIAGGTGLLCASAIHLGWGLWRPFSAYSLYLALVVIFHLLVIVGAWIGAILVNRLSKRVIYLISSIPIIVGNILFIVCYDQIELLLVARLLIGFVHGVLYVVLVCHGSENATKEMRGRVVGNIGFVLAGGVFISTCVVYLSSNVVIGAVSLGLTAIGLLLTAIFNYESVVFLLQKGDKHQEAFELMIKLRNESAPSSAIQNDYDELKDYVERESGLSRNILRNGNTRPLALVICLRVLAFVTNNLLLNMLMVVYAVILFDGVDVNPNVIPIMLTCVRYVFVLIPTIAGDRLGRKIFMAWAGYVGGLVLLITAILFQVMSIQTWLVSGLLISQAAFGSGLETVPHVVASEAFGLKKKPFSIAFVSSVEHLLHIGSHVLFYVLLANATSYIVIFTIAPIAVVLLTGGLQWLMPETRTMPLSQCRNEYLGGNHRGATYSRENVSSHQQGITHVN